MCHLKEAVRSRTFGVNDSLGDSLPVKLGEFVDKVEVLDQDGALGSSSHAVLVIIDWRTRTRGKSLFLHRVNN